MSAGRDPTVTFTRGEIEELRQIVIDWAAEGFKIPPYRDAQYSIFEKLGIDDNEGVYDMRRPSSTP